MWGDIQWDEGKAKISTKISFSTHKKKGFLLKGLVGFSSEQFLLSVEIFSFKKDSPENVF